MYKLYKAALVAVTVSILLVGAGCNLFQQAPQEGDDDVITFSLPQLFTGEEVTFPDDFAGEVVYLVYFANG